MNKTKELIWIMEENVGCSPHMLKRKLRKEIKSSKYHKSNYLRIVLTEDGKCTTERQMCTGMANVAFEKISKVLRKKKIS